MYSATKEDVHKIITRYLWLALSIEEGSYINGVYFPRKDITTNTIVESYYGFFLNHDKIINIKT